MNVFIITYCQSEANLPGNLLIFDSIRTGFPTADITVVDNGSNTPSVLKLSGAAAKVGAGFIPLLANSPKPHEEVLAWAVKASGSDPCVLLDPDMIFYRSVEGWHFPIGTLIAGARIPRFQDELTGCITADRFHTSFLWLPDPAELNIRIKSVQKQYFEWDPWKPIMLYDPHDSKWWRHDTGAQLFALFGGVRFTPDQADAYTHLIGGTDDYTLKHLPPSTASKLREFHRRAFEDPLSVKGAWREQEQYFRGRGYE